MDIPLYDLIKLKYEDAIIGVNGNVLFADYGDGNGPVIQYWNIQGVEQPTPDELLEFKADQNLQNLYQFQLNKQLNESIYKQLVEIDNKSIRALRTNDSVRLNDLEQQAVALRKQLLPVS